MIVHGPVDPESLAGFSRAPEEPLVLLVPPGTERLEVSGFCPVEIADEVTLVPLIDVESEPPPFGFDATFRVEVGAGCEAARAGTLTWASEAGRPLTVEDGGFVVNGRTPASTLVARGFGIVPVSARASGEDLLHLRFELGAVTIERTVRVRATSRASGVPSVPLGATLHLAGGPFAVREAPTPPILGALGALTTATFVAEGRYLFAAGDRTLAIRVGTHRGTPLDCGRSDCHRREAEAIVGSPMLAAAIGHLARRGEDALGCAAPCHTTSEPGLPDGGFAHVAREHGFRGPREEPEDAAALPRALRRLAGVGCTACHGPGAIPEEGARWAILRSDVCAVCHDAPPRYGHVAALATSAMARADAEPRARTGECAGCHTTAGFLLRVGARAETHVPDDAHPLGIACAACHAPHAAHDDALVRVVPVPAGFGEVTRDRICVPCHAPTEGSVRAAQAVFVHGQGALDPRTGAALAARSPHAPLGCTGCHAAPASSALERGAGHAFAIDEARCVGSGCHETVPPRIVPAEVLSRLAALPPTPPHDAASPAEGAVALLRADAAAWLHGPAYVEALLEAVEAARTR